MTTPKMYHSHGPSAQGLTIEDYRKARLTTDRLHLNSVPQTIIAQLSVASFTLDSRLDDNYQHG